MFRSRGCLPGVFVYKASTGHGFLSRLSKGPELETSSDIQFLKILLLLSVVRSIRSGLIIVGRSIVGKIVIRGLLADKGCLLGRRLGRRPKSVGSILRAVEAGGCANGGLL